MKKVLIVFVVIVLMLSMCGCGKVDELESENANLKEDIAELEEEVKELESKAQKSADEVKTLTDEKSSLESELDAANEKIDELEEEQALRSDTGLGFTPSEHYGYFMIQLNKSTMISTWKLGMQFKDPEYVTNKEGKELVAYRILDIGYDDILGVLYGTCPDGKHADSIMIQASKIGDNQYNNKYLELVFDMVYALVDYKIDMNEWKESDRSDIATAIFKGEEYAGIKLYELESSDGKKISFIKLAD